MVTTQLTLGSLIRRGALPPGGAENAKDIRVPAANNPAKEAIVTAPCSTEAAVRTVPAGSNIFIVQRALSARKTRPNP